MVLCTTTVLETPETENYQVPFKTATKNYTPNRFVLDSQNYDDELANKPSSPYPKQRNNHSQKPNSINSNFLLRSSVLGSLTNENLPCSGNGLGKYYNDSSSNQNFILLNPNGQLHNDDEYLADFCNSHLERIHNKDLLEDFDLTNSHFSATAYSNYFHQQASIVPNPPNSQGQLSKKPVTPTYLGKRQSMVIDLIASRPSVFPYVQKQDLNAPQGNVNQLPPLDDSYNLFIKKDLQKLQTSKPNVDASKARKYSSPVIGQTAMANQAQDSQAHKKRDRRPVSCYHNVNGTGPGPPQTSILNGDVGMLSNNPIPLSLLKSNNNNLAHDYPTQQLNDDVPSKAQNMTNSYGGAMNRNLVYVHDKWSQTSYLKGKLLGKGGFAKCYKFTDINTSTTFAAKVISKSQLSKSSHREQVRREIEIHKPLVHVNVVNLCSSFEDDYYMYIILEYCDNKTLVELIKDHGTLNDEETRFFMRQILSAVTYLHELRILHRDLKLGNMFLTRRFALKVGDFGLSSRICPESLLNKKISICGTPNYIAPEILAKTEHSFPSDVWAIGCIMYAMLCGKPPFESDSLPETYNRISRNIYRIPGHVTGQARDLITRLLTARPGDRIKLETARRHDYFTTNENPRQPTATNGCQNGRHTAALPRLAEVRKFSLPTSSAHSPAIHGEHVRPKRSSQPAPFVSPRTHRYNNHDNIVNNNKKINIAPLAHIQDYGGSSIEKEAPSAAPYSYLGPINGNSRPSNSREQVPRSSDLLRAIEHELGLNGYDKANVERSNLLNNDNRDIIKRANILTDLLMTTVEGVNRPKEDVLNRALPRCRKSIHFGYEQQRQPSYQQPHNGLMVDNDSDSIERGHIDYTDPKRQLLKPQSAFSHRNLNYKNIKTAEDMLIYANPNSNNSGNHHGNSNYKEQDDENVWVENPYTELMMRANLPSTQQMRYPAQDAHYVDMKRYSVACPPSGTQRNEFHRFNSVHTNYQATKKRPMSTVFSDFIPADSAEHFAGIPMGYSNDHYDQHYYAHHYAAKSGREIKLNNDIAVKSPFKKLFGRRHLTGGTSFPTLNLVVSSDQQQLYKRAPSIKKIEGEGVVKENATKKFLAKCKTMFSFSLSTNPSSAQISNPKNSNKANAMIASHSTVSSYTSSSNRSSSGCVSQQSNGMEQSRRNDKNLNNKSHTILTQNYSRPIEGKKKNSMVSTNNSSSSNYHSGGSHSNTNNHEEISTGNSQNSAHGQDIAQTRPSNILPMPLSYKGENVIEEGGIKPKRFNGFSYFGKESPKNKSKSYSKTDHVREGDVRRRAVSYRQILSTTPTKEESFQIRGRSKSIIVPSAKPVGKISKKCPSQHPITNLDEDPEYTRKRFLLNNPKQTLGARLRKRFSCVFGAGNAAIFQLDNYDSGVSKNGPFHLQHYEDDENRFYAQFLHDLHARNLYSQRAVDKFDDHNPLNNATCNQPPHQQRVNNFQREQFFATSDNVTDLENCKLNNVRQSMHATCPTMDNQVNSCPPIQPKINRENLSKLSSSVQPIPPPTQNAQQWHHQSPPAVSPRKQALEVPHRAQAYNNKSSSSEMTEEGNNTSSSGIECNSPLSGSAETHSGNLKAEPAPGTHTTRVSPIISAKTDTADTLHPICETRVLTHLRSVVENLIDQCERQILEINRLTFKHSRCRRLDGPGADSDLDDMFANDPIDFSSILNLSNCDQNFERLTCNRRINSSPNCDAPNSDTPFIWVTKWVDYAEKYGFGYQLSNGAQGVLFKDTGRIYVGSKNISIYGGPNDQLFANIPKHLLTRVGSRYSISSVAFEDANTALQQQLATHIKRSNDQPSPARQLQQDSFWSKTELREKLAIYAHFSSFMERNLVDDEKLPTTNKGEKTRNLQENSNEVDGDAYLRHTQRYVKSKKFMTTAVPARKPEFGENFGKKPATSRSPLSADKKYQTLFMRFNDGTVQVNFLTDHVKFVLGAWNTHSNDKLHSLNLHNNHLKTWAILIDSQRRHYAFTDCETNVLLASTVPQYSYNQQQTKTLHSLHIFKGKLKTLLQYLKDEIY